MAVEVLMPKLGLTMKTGTVTRWMKEVGDAVAEKEPLLEIETEKLTNIIEAPAGGVLVKKIGVVGEKYPIAAVLGYIGEAGEQIDGGDAPPAEEKAQPPVQTAPAAAAGEGGGRQDIYFSCCPKACPAEGDRLYPDPGHRPQWAHCQGRY